MHGGFCGDPLTLVEFGKHYPIKFQNARVFQEVSQKPSSNHNRKWIRQPTGTFKLNTNASVRTGSMYLGLRSVVRDSEGCVMAS